MYVFMFSLNGPPKVFPPKKLNHTPSEKENEQFVSLKNLWDFSSLD